MRATVVPEARGDAGQGVWPGALLAPAPTEAHIEIGEERAVVRNGAIAAEVGLEGRLRGSRAALRFLNAVTGDELLAEAPSHFPRYPARQFKPVGGEHVRVEARFKTYDGERIYGLGQHQHGRLDQKVGLYWQAKATAAQPHRS